MAKRPKHWKKNFAEQQLNVMGHRQQNLCKSEPVPVLWFFFVGRRPRLATSDPTA